MKYIVAIIALLVLIIGCAEQQAKATDFESCITAGNPAMESYPRQCKDPVVREIQVTAKKFEFVPETITVNKGNKVRLLITSIDVEHGFRLKTPFADISEKLPVNQEVVIEFTAAETGEYDFWCAVYCGKGHGGMRGKLVVK